MATHARPPPLQLSSVTFLLLGFAKGTRTFSICCLWCLVVDVSLKSLSLCFPVCSPSRSASTLICERDNSHPLLHILDRVDARGERQPAPAR